MSWKNVLKAKNMKHSNLQENKKNLTDARKKGFDSMMEKLKGKNIKIMSRSQYLDDMKSKGYKEPYARKLSVEYENGTKEAERMYATKQKDSASFRGKFLKEADIEKKKCPKCGKTHSSDLELASCGSHHKQAGAVTTSSAPSMFNRKVVSSPSQRKRKKYGED